MRRSNGVEDKIEALCMGFHFAGMTETTTSSAPSALAASRLDSDVVKATTCAPMACASLIPICPSPPIPTTPTFFAGARLPVTQR
jgi:hypothetical protein